MNEHGVITLMPETSVEAYALGRWAAEALVVQKDMARDESCLWRGSRLIVIAKALQEAPND